MCMENQSRQYINIRQNDRMNKLANTLNRMQVDSQEPAGASLHQNKLQTNH